MNVERLHAIALGLRSDFQATNIRGNLEQLADSIQKSITAPQEPMFQVQISDLREQIDEALANAPSNSFPPVWKQILDELDISSLLGESLRDEINSIFDSNAITPAAAKEDIERLAEELKDIGKRIDQLVECLDALGIGTESLQEGECELAVLIPRSAVSSELKALGREFEHLQKLFGPFSELVTGSRPELKVRSISSSDFGVFLSLPPETAACVALAVERIIALYKQLLEIRKLQNELKQQGLTNTELKGVKDHANKLMARGIGELVEGLLAKCDASVNDGRQNELKLELKFTLNGIARRLDEGYNMDVTAGPPDPNADAEHAAKIQVSIDAINKASPSLKFMNLSGDSILSLPESPDERTESSPE